MSYNSKEPHGKSNEKVKKLSKKQKAEGQKRQLLKIQIEKRKKRFRQINPHLAQHEKEDDEQNEQDF